MGQLNWYATLHCSGILDFFQDNMKCQKNSIPTHGRSLEFPGGRGVLKVKTVEAKYEAKLEFLGVGGGGGGWEV